MNSDLRKVSRNKGDIVYVQPITVETVDGPEGDEVRDTRIEVLGEQHLLKLRLWGVGGTNSDAVIDLNAVVTL